MYIYVYTEISFPPKITSVSKKHQHQFVLTLQQSQVSSLAWPRGKNPWRSQSSSATPQPLGSAHLPPPPAAWPAAWPAVAPASKQWPGLRQSIRGAVGVSNGWPARGREGQRMGGGEGAPWRWLKATSSFLAMNVWSLELFKHQKTGSQGPKCWFWCGQRVNYSKSGFEQQTYRLLIWDTWSTCWHAIKHAIGGINRYHTPHEWLSFQVDSTQQQSIRFNKINQDLSPLTIKVGFWLVVQPYSTYSNPLEFTRPKFCGIVSSSNSSREENLKKM